jgi:hypothetical protein
MTATTLHQPTISADTTTSGPSTTVPSRKLWRTGAGAGLAAGAAATAFAAVVDAMGVPLEVGGEQIPLLGFAQLTFVVTMIGTVLGVVLARRAQDPQRTFVRTTVVLTVLSFVPDVTADATTATRVALALSHVVAAAIVIPIIARRLAH